MASIQPYDPFNRGRRTAIGLQQQQDTHVLGGQQAEFSRGKVKRDTDQNQAAYTGLLDALKSKGYLDGGGSSAGASGSASGTWTPTWAPYSEPSGGPAGQTMPAPGPVAPVAPVAAVDTSGAQRAAFARAKDQVGQTAAGAMAGLRSSLGGRGLLGSGGESRGAAAIINQGQGELGDVSRQQAIDDAARAQRTAEFNYSGGVAQRGQDIGAADTARAQDIAVRGQDLSADAARRARGLDARGQDLTARGQNLSANESAASRSAAARQAQLDAILGLYKSFGSRPGAGTVY